MTPRAATGMCFDRSFPPALVTEMARRLDQGGADQLWLIEDCFYTAGISLAGAALAVTERLQVGLGILPAVARNPAVTAMEIATLCGLAPGRVLPGIGHGVQEWMAQMGARTSSPLTTLEEVIVAVTDLLAGQTVTVEGREVHLSGVALDQPPADPPPVLAGVRGPKSLAIAGRVAGGILLAEPASPAYVRWALDQAGRPDPFHVAVFAARRRRRAGGARGAHRGTGAPPVRRSARPAGPPARSRSTSRPASRRTLDDAEAHIAALEREGVDSIGLFPAPDVDIARSQVDDVLALARR